LTYFAERNCLARDGVSSANDGPAVDARKDNGMRKREIEKLLERAVAEALGVELKSTGRKIVKTATNASAEHRAAA
jgi:hypothetical protein